MNNKKAKKSVTKLLKDINWTINSDSQNNIRVLKEDNFYENILSNGHLALAEAYMDGDWECDNLELLFADLALSGIDDKIKKDWRMLSQIALTKLFNMQSKKRSWQVAREHYDLGNEFYKYFLDEKMIYTSGIWLSDEDELSTAQDNKLKAVCDRLELKEGDTLLDIGCGWGGLLKYAYDNYGTIGTGITLSVEQQKYCKEVLRNTPCKVLLQDYRDCLGKYDKIASIEMVEAVGHKNFKTYYRKIRDMLNDDGKALVQAIVGYGTSTVTDPFLDKYIFPNGLTPTHVQISHATEKTLNLQSYESFANSYYLTLMSWNENFQNNWEKISEELGFSMRFKKMWEYYLLMCAGLFKSGRMNVGQFLYHKF